MAFTTTARVRFADIDAAAIVFYPRYFEMLNAAVEDWFAAMDHDFRTLHAGRKIGLPTVKLECTFLAPSELGETLTIAIEPGQLGRSSCVFAFCFSGKGGDRLRGSATLVCMDLVAQNSIPWPDALRARMIETGAELKN